jgi:signal transduction histidine kinase
VLRLAEQVRQDQQPLMIPDLVKQPRFLLQTEAIFGSAGADVLVSGGAILGALVMIAEPRGRFGSAQAPFFSAIAHQAALAISNAQLHAQVQQLAILDERYRLSREIHDGLAQTLGSLGWQLDHLDLLLDGGDIQAARDVLAGTRQATREAYMDVREAIDGLRLAADHASGLASVLAEYVEDFEDRSGIETDFQASEPVTPVMLTPEAELQLLRIAQEGLTNVRKHANARHAWVTLRSSLEQVELTVADDGRGFDPRLPRGRQHVGLTGIRERAHSLGGTVTIATSPGQGTRLTVTAPIHP